MTQATSHLPIFRYGAAHSMAPAARAFPVRRVESTYGQAAAIGERDGRSTSPRLSIDTLASG